MTYNSKPSKDYCEQLGLSFSQEDFDAFVEASKGQKLTQKNVNFIMRQHAWRVKCLFNPKGYRYIDRIKLALFFLNPFAKDLS